MEGLERPETRFAWNGDVSLAYQIVGDGASDLLYLQGYCSQVDLNWESPYLSHFLRGLAVFVDTDSFLPETGRLAASRIPDARLVEHSSQGGHHFHWYARGDASRPRVAVLIEFTSRRGRAPLPPARESRLLRPLRGSPGMSPC